MIRTIFTMFTTIILTLIASLLSIIFGIVNPYSKLVYFVAQFWSRGILFAAGVKMETFGLENIQAKENYIFVSNHQSHFDVLAIFSTLPLTARFIAKKELYKIPLFGWALAAVGNIKIDRSDREKSIISMNKALNTIKGGVSVIVFPEGTRSKDGNLQNFKKGGFVIAIKGNLPIIPVSISGSRFILKKHSLRIASGKIKLVFGKPINTANYTYSRRSELIEDVRKVILKNIDKEVNKN